MTCNLIERLQHRCFLVNISKFLRTPILKASSPEQFLKKFKTFLPSSYSEKVRWNEVAILKNIFERLLLCLAQTKKIPEQYQLKSFCCFTLMQYSNIFIRFELAFWEMAYKNSDIWPLWALSSSNRFVSFSLNLNNQCFIKFDGELPDFILFVGYETLRNIKRRKLKNLG